jgi:hypothetical protein
MVPVFIPFVLIAENRNIGVTGIFEVQRSELGFLAN